MIPRVVPKLEDLDQPQTMIVPSFQTHNAMFFRPAPAPPQDEHMFSAQFYNPETFSIFNVSPARIDPGLLPPSNEPTRRLNPHLYPADTLTPTKTRLPPITPSPPRMYPIKLSPLKLSAEAATSMGSPACPVSNHAIQPMRIKKHSNNKRYQYWTPAEDQLVRHLREDLSWTWKDISQELHRKLKGVHSWQAVQMRYLRAIRKRPDAQDLESNVEQPLAIYAPEAKPPTMDDVEAAIKRDWETRWVRLSAVLGSDITTHECSELLASGDDCVRNFVEPE